MNDKNHLKGIKMGNPELEADATLDSTQDSKSVDYEKRFKDTQAAYTKSQQELKELKAKTEVLEKLARPKVELDEATRRELEELKYSDPDAWRNKVNSLEAEATVKHNESISEAQRQVSQHMEMENRHRVLAEFQSSHPDIVINDDVINLDVPKRITDKLESGKVGFADFLIEVKDYLQKGKVIGTDSKPLGQPNLSLVGGDHAPTKDAKQKNVVRDYAKLVF